MKRLVCIVEGKGDVLAWPRLCVRILAHLGITGWYVDEQPVRQPRSRLVDESKPPGRRTCNPDGLKRALSLALARHPDAVLVSCDADDDCAALWDPSADEVIRGLGSGAAVMAVREFEGWFLHGRPLHGPPESIRDAKGAMRKFIPNYKATTHQAEETRHINVGAVMRSSRSFRRLVKIVQILCT
jgi:hypothetical protein